MCVGFISKQCSSFCAQRYELWNQEPIIILSWIRTPLVIGNPNLLAERTRVAAAQNGIHRGCTVFNRLFLGRLEVRGLSLEGRLNFLRNALQERLVIDPGHRFLIIEQILCKSGFQYTKLLVELG